MKFKEKIKTYLKIKIIILIKKDLNSIIKSSLIKKLTKNKQNPFYKNI
jgi:hypothetical protein